MLLNVYVVLTIQELTFVSYQWLTFVHDTNDYVLGALFAYFLNSADWPLINYCTSQYGFVFHFWYTQKSQWSIFYFISVRFSLELLKKLKVCNAWMKITILSTGKSKFTWKLSFSCVWLKFNVFRYILYKIPHIKKGAPSELIKNGFAYMYLTSDNDENWTLSNINIMDNEKSFLATTLAPVYQSKVNFYVSKWRR